MQFSQALLLHVSVSSHAVIMCNLRQIRAFGRPLLPGTVHDHGDGRYTITILPHDVGAYTVKVVLTIYQKPDFDSMPVPGKVGEPCYEGFMLPGFPITFLAVEANSNQPSSSSQQQLSVPRCTARQLLETSPTSALETGRWLVVNKTR